MLTDARRVERAQDQLAAIGADALVVGPGADLRYLTGYAALPLERLTCLVVPAEGRASLVVPRLEEPRALASPVVELSVDVIAWQETDDAFALVAELMRNSLGRLPRALAVSDRMWAAHALRLAAAAGGAELTAAGAVMRALRIRKTPQEIDALADAARAIDTVHERLRSWRWVGRTEREIGHDIADAIVDAGHEVVNFVIVGSGPNAASPHHDLSDRVVERGDVVVVDIGGTNAAGYCSDSTRTYAVGAPPAEFIDYYAVLKDAQETACVAVQPGLPAQDIDAAARDVIARAGFGEYFVHRTGHGIGLEEHEDPYIVAGNHEVLEPGMCFSIEPGIYLPQRHGARIEDIVVVTDGGGRRLNTLDRDYVVVDA